MKVWKYRYVDTTKREVVSLPPLESCETVMAEHTHTITTEFRMADDPIDIELCYVYSDEILDMILIDTDVMEDE